MYQRLRNQPLGIPPNIEEDNVAINVSIIDNDSDEFGEEFSDERQTKKNLGTKKDKLSSRSLTFG